MAEAPAVEVAIAIGANQVISLRITFVPSGFTALVSCCVPMLGAQLNSEIAEQAHVGVWSWQGDRYANIEQALAQLPQRGIQVNYTTC